MTKNNHSTREGIRFLLVTVLILAASVTTALAQTTIEPVAPRATAWSNGSGPDLFYEFGSLQKQNVPQDVRIMQKIVSTALSEVTPPELPDELKSGEEEGRSGYVYSTGSDRNIVVSGISSNRFAMVGSRDVSGFYMNGYGYLFTVKWRVGGSGLPGLYFSSGWATELLQRSNELNQALMAAQEAKAAEPSKAATETERKLQDQKQKLEAQAKATAAWEAEYRTRLTDALKNVVAGYGSTLKRAQAGESITFIADLGGGEAEKVTLTARRGDLTGANSEANLRAVKVSKGASGVSEKLKTQLKIMAEIIDASLQQGSGSGYEAVVVAELAYYGGDSTPQYVPGYGVIFKKNARFSTMRTVRLTATAAPRPSSSADVVTTETLQAQLEQNAEDARKLYQEHLDGLKKSTADILATYGPTLTELKDDDWVGIYYDVGSASALLAGGGGSYLVQARMRDVRQSASQSDAAAWLLARLVTNEESGGSD